MSKLLRNPLVLQRIMLVLIGVFGIGYLVTLSVLSTRGYRLSDLDAQVAALTKENQKLNIAIVELSSPKRVEDGIKDSGMVIARNVRYINAETGTLSMR